MVKYKVNVMFNEKGKSLNELITDTLKIKMKKNDLLYDYTNYPLKKHDYV